MENEKLKLTDEDGNVLEYTILSTFIYNNKNYIIYTDDASNDGEYDAYAAIFDPNDDTVWEEVKTDEEWDIINEVLTKMRGDDYHQ